MFRIKLLILLSASFILFNCSTQSTKNTNDLKIGYIGGEEDGLIFKNLLLANLKASNIYNANSHLLLDGNINHSTSFYITNTDNTSDREQVKSSLKIKILNNQNNCTAYNFDEEVSQFYIVASSTVFTSNDAALEEIKKNNAENLIKMFIFDFSQSNLLC